jgi:putative PIN family toxin of toxin-antitoxin system
MRKNKQLKLVLDTNIWISFIITGKFYSLDELIYSDRARLLFSEELLEEIARTIQKPKLKRYFTGVDPFAEMFLAFEPYINMVKVHSTVDVCRDARDNFLFALAKDGKADILITGDQDLLTIGRFGSVRVMTISGFLREFA